MALFDIFRSKQTLRLIDLVKRSYKSVRVVGRGTIKIDPAEIRATPEFKEAQRKAAEIVERSREKY